MTDMSTNSKRNELRAGMIGLGMIFEETYQPFFERAQQEGLFDRRFGDLNIPLVAVASRTGRRAEAYREAAGNAIHPFDSCAGADAVKQLIDSNVQFACVASPDDRHFEAAKALIEAGVHVLIEKPSVLDLRQLDELVELARQNSVLAKIV